MIYHYFVEGECEQALLKAFMHASSGEYVIHPGKIDVFNVLTQRLSPSRVMALKKRFKSDFHL